MTETTARKRRMPPKIDTPTARKKLDVRPKPYWVKLWPTKFVGYRRNQGPGSWSDRDDTGGWIKQIGLADDLEAADGKRVLDFKQAVEEARKLFGVPTDPADPDKPFTINDALDRYEAHLRVNNGDLLNVTRVRNHLPAELGAKAVLLLDVDTLQAFRDGLARKIAISSTNRTCKMLARALNSAAEKDKRVFAVRHAWKVGLAALKGGTRARRFVEIDAPLATRIVHQAYLHDPAFGLFVEVHAGGARTSQICRLEGFIICHLKWGVMGILQGLQLPKPLRRQNASDWCD